jgi:hypothetical protein
MHIPHSTYVHMQHRQCMHTYHIHIAHIAHIAHALIGTAGPEPPRVDSGRRITTPALLRGITFGDIAGLARSDHALRIVSGLHAVQVVRLRSPMDAHVIRSALGSHRPQPASEPVPGEHLRPQPAVGPVTAGMGGYGPMPIVAHAEGPHDDVREGLR